MQRVGVSILLLALEGFVLDVLVLEMVLLEA